MSTYGKGSIVAAPLRRFVAEHHGIGNGRRLIAYALAMVLPVAVVAIRLAIGYKAGDPPSLILFCIPIGICAYLSGAGPGFVCTLASMWATNYFLLAPLHSLAIDSPILVVQWLTLAVVGALLSMLFESLHRSMDRIEANRNIFAVTLASIADGVITTDSKALVTSINPEAERLTGWRSDEAIHSPLQSTFQGLSARSRQSLDNPVAAVLAHGNQTTFADDALLISKDGRETAIEYRAAPIRNQKEDIVGIVVSFRDCSQKRREGEMLRQSEERLRQALRVSNIGIFDHDHLTNTIYWSPEQRAIYQWGPGEPVTLERYFAHVHPDDVAAITKAVKDAHDPSGSGLFDVEHRIIRRDGEIRWLTTRSQTFFEGEGKSRCPTRTIGAVLDVTEGKKADDRIVRLNKLYATLSEINQTIVRVASEEELFPRITHIAIEHGGLVCAWIGMINEKTGWLIPIVKEGPSASYADNIRISIDPSLPEGHGPEGVALREGRNQIINDLPNVDQTSFWHDAAQKAGIRSSIAMPLRREGKVVGLMSLYSDEPHFFVDDVVRLFDEMAMDISFALDNCLREKRRQAAERSLQDSETRMRLAVNAAQLGIYDVNFKTGERSFNNEYAVMLEYDPATFRETTTEFNERIHPSDRAIWRSAYRGYLKGRLPIYQVEFRLRTARGNWKWILATGTAVERDERGKPIRFVGTHLDISDRKASEEQMRLVASVFESSHDTIVITDANLSIIAVNKAFSETTGYSAEEALGKHISLLKSGRHEDGFYDEMWRQINDVGYWQGEVWDRRKNGDIYPNLKTISAVRNQSGVVTHYVDIAADITQDKRAEEQIKQLAYYDALTGVPNRVLLQDRAKRELAQAHRAGTEIALFFVDLDRFKNINDSLGHVMGDRLLQELANRLRATVRDTDTVCRLGGDEFLLLFSIDGINSAARIAQKLLSAIGEPFQIDNHSLRITPSIGISLYPKDGSSFEELLKNADVAMYKAKESGRNTFNFFTPEMNAGALDRLMLEGALRQALGADQLELHYQPQISLKGGCIIGAEALVRWRHPERGQISPGRFIPIAEECGLITSLGEWVLKEACGQLRRWDEAGAVLPSIAVNLSSRQFTVRSISDVIANTLKETGLSGTRLEVEITESILLQDIENTLEALHRLKEMGIRVAVDDFGTGYSSLSYLKRFPLDRLKIDKSFVHDVTDDPDDQAIASAVINLGHSMGLVVIAEGVETQEQLKMLGKMGCDGAQGYFFAKPMPADEMGRFLKAYKPFTEQHSKSSRLDH
ncbi:MAG: EAL domain-containing protein [Gammaproteobacteria bacterium]